MGLGHSDKRQKHKKKRPVGKHFGVFSPTYC